MQGYDHGGGFDAAIERWGGEREDWLDLSTGINPNPYPVPAMAPSSWSALPDSAAAAALDAAARDFWMVPEGAGVLAASGVSGLIAAIPRLLPPGRVQIAERSCAEHRAAFEHAGWQVTGDGAVARVVMNPDNPTGRMWTGADEPAGRPLLVIDESFCDVALGNTHVRELAKRPGVLILKSLSNFWGLAGLRLGFAIGDPGLVARLARLIGPMPVSRPAQIAGRAALEDMRWANQTRQRFTVDVARMDAVVEGRGAALIGGTALFRLYQVKDARAWQERLAKRRIWSRTFSHSPTWLRLGLPPSDRWAQLEAGL